MKQASRVLGIVSGLVGAAGAYLAFQKIGLMYSLYDIPEFSSDILSSIGLAAHASASMRDGFVALAIVGAALCAVGAVLGIIGGMIARKNCTAAAVMMTAGGVLSVFSDFSVVIIPMMLMGGIFALICVGEPALSGARPQDSRGVETAAMLLGISGGSINILTAVFIAIVLLIQGRGTIDISYETGLFLLIALGGVVAAAGGVFVKKRRWLAGMLMLIGSAISALSEGFSEALPSVFLLTGGVFAFISRRPVPAAGAQESTG